MAAIWGSSFILIKKGLLAFSPTQTASIRVSAAVLTLLPFALPALGRFPRRRWPYLLGSGLMGILLPAFLFAFAQTRLDSAVAGVLNALTPVFTLLVGMSFFKTPLARNQLIGVMIGFLGAFSLVVTRTEARPLAFNTAGLLVIAATILYGINSNWIKKYLTGYPLLEVASLSLFIISPAALSGLWLTGVFQTWQTQSGAGMAAAYLILLGIFSTGLATVLFYQLIQMTSAVFASSVTYLIPLVALMWGTLDGENIGLAQLAGMGIILLGVWLINQRKAIGK